MQTNVHTYDMPNNSYSGEFRSGYECVCVCLFQTVGPPSFADRFSKLSLTSKILLLYCHKNAHSWIGRLIYRVFKYAIAVFLGFYKMMHELCQKEQTIRFQPTRFPYYFSLNQFCESFLISWNLRWAFLDGIWCKFRWKQCLLGRSWMMLEVAARRHQRQSLCDVWSLVFKSSVLQLDQILSDKMFQLLVEWNQQYGSALPPPKNAVHCPLLPYDLFFRSSFSK